MHVPKIIYEAGAKKSQFAESLGAKGISFLTINITKGKAGLKLQLQHLPLLNNPCYLTSYLREKKEKRKL